MQTICFQKPLGRTLLFVLPLLTLAAGCGGQTKGTVSGKVTYQGKPLSGGIVTFVPETGAPQHADITSDGTYRMAGAPLGLVKIGVEAKSGKGTNASSGMPRSPKDYGKLKAAMTDSGGIPPKYTDPNKSELTYTVKNGQQQHDIDLK